MGRNKRESLASLQAQKRTNKPHPDEGGVFYVLDIPSLPCQGSTCGLRGLLGVPSVSLSRCSSLHPRCSIFRCVPHHSAFEAR